MVRLRVPVVGNHDGFKPTTAIETSRHGVKLVDIETNLPKIGQKSNFRRQLGQSVIGQVNEL